MSADMTPSAKVYVAGHRGLVGSALVRGLKDRGYEHIVARTHEELDLTDYEATMKFFADEKPEYVFLAAAKVGGIMANATYPADFIRANLLIQTNVIHACQAHGVRKMLFLGSSCIYPKMAPQPLKEEYLLTGPLEPTNEAYAVAKIAGITMCHAYRKQHDSPFVCVMPTNLFGPEDDFDPETSHVLPALIQKFHTAKESGSTSVELWGDGTPRREFLYSNECAQGCIHLMEHVPMSDMPTLINIGVGSDIAIKELAEVIADIVGFSGEITWDTSKPNGTPRKRLDVSTMDRLGWKSSMDLKTGIERTYDWYLSANKR